MLPKNADESTLVLNSDGEVISDLGSLLAAGMIEADGLTYRLTGDPAGGAQGGDAETPEVTPEDAAQAAAGSITAIQQLQGAGQAFISQSERFGASPAAVSARTEVAAVIESVTRNLTEAQREASAGVEGAVRTAQTRIVDTLKELIISEELTRDEIKRLSRR